MLKAKLVVVGGDAKKTEIRLHLPTIIGRGKEAGLTVPHALVSRQHAEIFEQDGRLLVRDLGSLNGTYINSTRIEGEQQLDPNQLLTLGNITFRAVYEIVPSGFANSAPDGETVTFEEEKTLSAAEVGGSAAIQTVSNQRPVAPGRNSISFDETVPVDLIVSAPKPASLPEETSESNDHSNRKSDLLDDTEETNSSASDTDKSIVDMTTDDSSISDSFFNVDSDESDPANKSVSVSALDDLPAGRSAISFAGSFDAGEEQKPLSQFESVDIDLGEDENQAKAMTDSSLGSFLKKLPK